MKIEGIVEKLVGRCGGRKGVATAGVVAVSLGVLAVPALASSQSSGHRPEVRVARMETPVIGPQAAPITTEVEEVVESVPAPAPVVDTTVATPQETQQPVSPSAPKSTVAKAPAPPKLNAQPLPIGPISVELPVVQPPTPPQPPVSDPPLPPAKPGNSPFAVPGYANYEEYHHHSSDGLPRVVRFEYPLASHTKESLCGQYLQALQAAGWSLWSEGCTAKKLADNYFYSIDGQGFGGTPNAWQAQVNSWIDNDHQVVVVSMILTKVWPALTEADAPFIVPGYSKLWGSQREEYFNPDDYYREFFFTYAQGEGLCQAYVDAAHTAGWTTEEVTCDAPIGSQSFDVVRGDKTGHVGIYFDDNGNVEVDLITFPQW